MVALATVVGFVVLTAGPAWANGGLELADPPPDAVLATAPDQVTMTFTADVQPELSHIEVFDDSGAEVSSGGYTQPEPKRMRLPLDVLAAGDYTIAYHVTFPDGTDLTDLHRFSVGTGTPPAPLDAATRQASTDAVSQHAHRIDGFSATLLVIDGLVLLVVLAMLWLRPRDGRPMTLRPDPST